MPIPRRATRAWLAFVPVLVVYAFVATRNLTLPGLYMDAVNPDYLVVKVLNPHHEPVVAWVLDGNYLLRDRFPLLIALYHGSAPFWLGLPLYWLLGTSVEGIRLTHAAFGLGVVAALYYLLLRLRVRPLVAALACTAMAIDPAFTYAFRTQSQITLGACAWLLLALATLPWERSEAPRRAWVPAVSGIFYGWSIVSYFIYGFFFPALAAAVALLARASDAGRRYPLRWAGGLFLGLVPSLVGYALLVRDKGGLAPTLQFFQQQQAALGVFASSLSLDERLAYAWIMLRGVVSDAWHHSMMFGEWVEVPATGAKLALLAGVPLAVLALTELRSRGVPALRLLVALPFAFVVASLVFGNRLGGHHYIVLLPLLYAGVAVALECLDGALRPPRAVWLGMLLAIGAVNVAGQVAEARRLEETHGTGLMSDAINHLAEDLDRAARKPFVYFPDWGLALPVALVTRGSVGMDSVENFEDARRMLCEGKDVAVALLTDDRDARRHDWERRLAWDAPDLKVYRQFDGKALFDLVTFRGDPRGPGCAAAAPRRGG